MEPLHSTAYSNPLLVSKLYLLVLVRGELSEIHVHLHHHTTTVRHALNLQETRSHTVTPSHTHTIIPHTLTPSLTHTSHTLSHQPLVEVVKLVRQVGELAWRAVDVDEAGSKGRQKTCNQWK